MTARRRSWVIWHRCTRPSTASAPGAQLDADLLSRIDAAWSRYDFWGTGDNPGSPTGTGDTADALRSIDRFSFGLALRQGLELTAEIHPRTSEDGAKLMTALSMIDMALKTRQPKDSGAKFNLDSDHGTLRVSVTVPEQELREAIQAQRASMVAAVSSRVRGAGPQTARARVQPGLSTRRQLRRRPRFRRSRGPPRYPCSKP